MINKEFSHLAGVGVLSVGLTVSGCSTTNVGGLGNIPLISKGTIVHDRFGDDCFSEFNERSKRLYVSITCSAQEMQQAQSKHDETSTSVIREKEGNPWLARQRNVPVIPTPVEAESSGALSSSPNTEQEHSHSAGGVTEATPTESPASDPLLEGLSGGRQHSHRHEHECITQDSNTGNYIITKLEHDHSHGVSSEDDNKQHAYPHLHAEYCQPPKPIDSFDVKPNQGGVVKHGLNFN